MYSGKGLRRVKKAGMTVITWLSDGPLSNQGLEDAFLINFLLPPPPPQVPIDF